VGVKGVLLVTGAGATGETGLYWHIVTDGTTYGGILNRVSNLFAAGSDVRLRVEVLGDTYSAYVNGSTTPAASITTNLFSSGRVALYDNSRQSFDDVVLSAQNVIPEPSAIVLLGIGALVLPFGISSRRRGRS
jgi:hypothetical protein